MAFYGCTGGEISEDGNDIIYPILEPSTDNKLYKETDVNAIAVVIGKPLKISEMADAVQKLSNGLRVIDVVIYTTQYTSSDLEDE